jgi:hypothetical protein
MRMDESYDEQAFIAMVLGALVLLVWLARRVHPHFRRRFPKDARSHESVAFSLPFGDTIAITAIAAIGAMFLCLVLSLRYNFHSVTATAGGACTARNKMGSPAINFWPSISAAIGDHTPQVYIWRIGITFMMQHRFLAGYADFCSLVAMCQR